VTLAELIEDLPVEEVRGDASVEITNLALDSRNVTPGTLFFALKGRKTDGAEFAGAAVEAGAVAVVAEDRLPIDVTQVWVRKARPFMAQLAARFFRNPSADLRVFGVTGTNGKTTTAFLMKHLSDRSNTRCGLVGTIESVIGGEPAPAVRTTPEAIDLQNLLAQMRDAGDRAVSMEVSSIALDQDRTGALQFDAGVFTNLTQDHLDYHGTMERYFDAKSLFFEQMEAETSKKARGIINLDDRFGKRLHDRFSKSSLPLLTYGQSVGCDFRAGGFRTTLTGSSFQLEARKRSFLVKTPLIGKFNVYNALAALTAAVSTGFDIRGCVQALAESPQVPGRLQRVEVPRNYQTFVDYAHTPDALENVAQAISQLKPSRFIIVFGCGGDRDRAKRPLMAQAAERYADWCIITSDNPRTEDPEEIIGETAKGMRNDNYETITDRKEAIQQAVEYAGSGDVILIAGKGHETYQEFADRTIDFDDVAVAKRAMEERRPEI